MLCITERWAVACAVATSGCAIDLARDHAPEEPPATVERPEGCIAFQAEGISGVLGRVRRFAAGSEVYAVVDGVVFGDGRELGPAVGRIEPADASDCLGRFVRGTVHALFGGAELADGAWLAPLDVVDDGSQVALFVERGFGLSATATTIAYWDPVEEVFIPVAHDLFTADRPRFGDAVLSAGGWVYAYGCRASGFLEERCYAARVARDQLDDPTAYAFYRGGGAGDDVTWDIEAAFPMFTGGHGLEVWAEAGRVFVASTTPLGDTIELRWGLSPLGPWSGSSPLVGCRTADDVFCSGVTQSSDPTGWVVGYGGAAFEDVPIALKRTRAVRVARP